MSGGAVILLSPYRTGARPRLRNQIPHYDPKRLGLRLDSTRSHNGRSEYQTAYTKLPYQPPRTCIRPETNQIPNIAQMEENTTYKNDFVPHILPKKKDKKDGSRKKHGGGSGNMKLDTTYMVDFVPKRVMRLEPFKEERDYQKPSDKFRGKTMYQVSYQGFDPELAKQCRPNQVKPTACIVPRKEVFSGSSTFSNDYKKPENVEVRKPIIPEESTRLSKDAMVTKTLYKEVYTEKKLPQEYKKMLQDTVLTPSPSPKPDEVTEEPNVVEEVKETPLKESQEKIQMITTFAADFKPHYNVSRRTSCKPPESDHQFYDAKFDGKTTQGNAYKVWPVSAPEKPQWAIKPDYKRPQMAMQMDSTYIADFKSPGRSKYFPVQPVKMKEKGDIIKHQASGDADGNTTYTANFVDWPESTPAKSFLVKQVYEAPKETMVCQSTQRTHYRGEPTQRAALCRQVSEHRDLYKNATMVFSTTYKDTYKDNRPKSCPAKVGAKHSPGTETPENVLKKDRAMDCSKDSGIDLNETDS